MTNYCGLDGDVDLENARRTALAYLFSGDWDPSLNPTKAPAGTIFMGNGGLVAGKLWQKQDDGCSTNWTLKTDGIIGALQFIVDPILGNDTVGRPFKTLAAAFAAAAVVAGPPGGGSPTFPRPVVVAMPGRYTEPSPTLPFNVSLYGFGLDNTVLANDLLYVAASGEAGRSDVIDVGINGNFNIDCSLGFNTNIRFIESRCSLIWNGGPSYQITQVNNFLGHASAFNDVVIVDGAVHLYNTQGIFSSLNVTDGLVPTSFPFLEIVGGLVQGSVTATGKAQIFSRALLNEAVWNGVANGGGLRPLMECDSSSFPIGANMTGVWRVQNDDNLIVPITGNYTMQGNERVIKVNASAGPVLITGAPANQIQCVTTIKKIDATANAVTSTFNVDGAPLNLAAQYQKATITSDGSVFMEI